jgi:pantoate--beta-alanine ligase
MTLDLGLGTRVVGVPTVRDEDGLALSSRNALLSDDERARAVALPTALNEAAEAIRAGESVGHALDAAKARLTDAGFAKVDYVALVDEGSLEPLSERSSRAARLIAAAAIGATRLIDNLAV